MAKNFDAVVVGGGTLGLSAAYHAAKRGLKVALIDQFRVPDDDGPNAMGSSRGLERMFRIMYAEPDQVRLVETAYAMWHEMQDQVSNKPAERILVEQDLLFFGNSKVETFEGNIKNIMSSMDTLGIPYDYLGNPGEIAARYKIFNQDALKTPDDIPYVGLVQNNGATINVKRSFQVIRQLAVSTEKLTSITGKVVKIARPQNSDDWVVGTENGDQYTTKYLILVPGIWLNEVLCHFNLRAYSGENEKWQIWQMSLAYFEPGDYGKGHWPIWYEFGNTKTDQQRLFYGFPDVSFTPDTRGKLKISADYTNTYYTDPSQMTNKPDDRLIQAIQIHLSQLLKTNVLNWKRPYFPQACPYSMSPDGDIVIGKIPTAPETADYWPNASFLCMAAGRGFKYTPVFGRILVDLAVDGQTAYENDIERFNPIRKNVFETIINRK